MTYDAREFARVRNPVLLMSAIAWILLFIEPGGLAALAHCPAMGSREMQSPASLAAGWALMLIAMMSPVLIAPLAHIRLRSFTHRRLRSMALFVAGYAAVWMALGAVVPGVRLFTPRSYPAAAVAVIALVWQFSPVKQRCLNRCHAHPELAAFGAAADFDALRFGATHGIWCAGSCWALMLFPMLLPKGHAVAMAAVAVLVFDERLEQPMPPCWRPRGLGKVIRIAIAQGRMHRHA